MPGLEGSSPWDRDDVHNFGFKGGEATRLPGAYETPMRTMASAENELRDSKILGQKIYFE